MNYAILRRLSAFLLVGLLGLASCRTCPIVACHTRKVHLHGGKKYRGQPLWKKQNPSVGEKIKVYKPDKVKRENDNSRDL